MFALPSLCCYWAISKGNQSEKKVRFLSFCQKNLPDYHITKYENGTHSMRRGAMRSFETHHIHNIALFFVFSITLLFREKYRSMFFTWYVIHSCCFLLWVQCDFSSSTIVCVEIYWKRVYKYTASVARFYIEKQIYFPINIIFQELIDNLKRGQDAMLLTNI